MFTTQNNDRLANLIRSKASPLYQSRVPVATQTNASDIFDKMFSDERTRNEFVDALVNQIGRIVVQGMSWSNPLAVFKTGMLAYGDTIESVQIGLLKSHAYDTAKDYGERDIWGRELPEIQSRFHKINRQEWYKVTVNDSLLRRAFTTDTGLSDFVTRLMATPANSDQMDEFLQMADLFRQYHKRGGFFIKAAPDFAGAVTDEQIKDFLADVRALVDTVSFPNVNYNSAHMPVFSTPEDLVLFLTPTAKAKIDVHALAAAFHIDKAEATARIMTIPPEFVNITGQQAILASRDFFVVADTLLENRSSDNAAGLYRNYFFHHHQIISMSPFATAVLFSSTDTPTVIEAFNPVPATAVDGSIVTPEGVAAASVERGKTYVVKVALTPADSTSAVKLTLEAASAIQATTVLYETGELVVSPWEENTSLDVIVTSLDNKLVTEKITVPIAAAPAALESWPLDRPGNIPGDAIGDDDA